MKQWIEIWHTQKEQEGILYKNGAGINKLSNLKLWAFFWGHGEWPLF